MGAGSTLNTTQYYDSHTGIPGENLTKISLGSDENNLKLVNPTQYTEVPIDFTEWYFICATYNPMVDELNSNSSVIDGDYWRNNMVDNGTSTPTEYTSYSAVGNRSKVEIISKSDLLRARGYQFSQTQGMSEPIEQT